MATFRAKVKFSYDLSVDVDAQDAESADAEVLSAMDNYLSSIEGTYGTTVIGVTRSEKKIISFYNKSKKNEENQKRQTLKQYLSSLSVEERELLFEIIEEQ